MKREMIQYFVGIMVCLYHNPYKILELWDYRLQSVTKKFVKEFSEYWEE